MSAHSDSPLEAVPTTADAVGELELLDLLFPLARRWKLLLLLPLVAGGLALGLSYLIKPTFTAHTTFATPQQRGSSGLAAALSSSLGPLASLATASAGFSSTGDMLVSLLKSYTVRDRLIEQYKLQEVYRVKYKFEARDTFDKKVRVSLGKKDGLITIEVDDSDPKRAADLANSQVAELQRLTAGLSLTESRRRREFFEAQLKGTKERLVQAQRALEGSGFGQGALRAEPKAAADEYARLKAQAVAGEVRLQALRGSRANTAPEVQEQQAMLAAIQRQIAAIEAATPRSDNNDYVGRYREFKYQETLFDLMARQYEAARLDESREEPLVQVIDKAEVPEWKSAPKRTSIAAVSAMLTLLLVVIALITTHLWRLSARSPERARKLERLRAAFRGR